MSKQKKYEIKHLHLSFSDLCGGQCLYCPGIRATANKRDRIMREETLNKILADILADSTKNSLETITISENGDCFLNKSCLPFLKKIRQELPRIKTIAYINPQNSQRYIEDIARFNLLDDIWTNIDSLNKEYNKFLSRVDYLFGFRVVKKLVELRKRYNSSYQIHILVLTLKKYLDSCRKRIGEYPSKLKNNPEFRPELIKDDYGKIKKKIKPLLSKKDSINRSFIYLWAEYANIKSPNFNFDCPMLGTFEENIFINPDGQLYLCCYDSNYNLSYGNVKEKSIKELFFSQERKNLIEMLKNKEYLKIGFPCRYVQLCQRDKPTIRAKILSRLQRYPWTRVVINKLRKI